MVEVRQLGRIPTRPSGSPACCSSAPPAEPGTVPQGTAHRTAGPARASCRVAPAPRLEEQHAAGHRDVEALGRASHRDREQLVDLACTSSGSPWASLPSTSATGPPSAAASVYGVPPVGDRAAAAAARARRAPRAQPGGRRRPRSAPRRPSRPTRARPWARRRRRCPVRRRHRPRPTASAARTSVPTLPGSETPASTSTHPPPASVLGPRPARGAARRRGSAAGCGWWRAARPARARAARPGSPRGSPTGDVAVDRDVHGLERDAAARARRAPPAVPSSATADSAARAEGSRSSARSRRTFACFGPRARPPAPGSGPRPRRAPRGRS